MGTAGHHVRPARPSRYHLVPAGTAWYRLVPGRPGRQSSKIDLLVGCDFERPPRARGPHAARLAMGRKTHPCAMKCGAEIACRDASPCAFQCLLSALKVFLNMLQIMLTKGEIH